MKRMRWRRGVALVWTAVALVALLGVVGLASDTGLVMVNVNELQNATDAAAMAAARHVRSSAADARLAAINVAAANLCRKTPVTLDGNDANDAAGDIVLGQYDRDTRTFTATTSGPNAVKIVARRTQGSTDGPIPLLFAGIFGVNSVDIERTAIAMVGGGTGAGLIALNQSAQCALDVFGNATLYVNGGDVQVNSSHNKAACTQGNAVIDAPSLNVNGGYDGKGNSTVTGEVYEDQPTMPDPLVDLPAPPIGPAMSPAGITTGGTFGPGYYPDGIQLSGSGTTILQPGIYVLGGAGLDISGTVTLDAQGVMFYLIDDAPVNLTGTGDIHVTPIESGVYEGMAIFQARDNTAASTIIGTSGLNLEGTLYFPNAHLNIGGTGDGFGNQLIADTVEVFGDGIKTIVYDGRNAAAGTKVFLVE